MGFGCHSINIYKHTMCYKWEEMLHRWGEIYGLKLCQIFPFSFLKMIVTLQHFLSFLQSSIHHIHILSIDFFLSNYYVPTSLLDTRNMPVNKTD